MDKERTQGDKRGKKRGEERKDEQQETGGEIVKRCKVDASSP